MKELLLVSALSVLFANSYGQAGTPDSSFGTNGIVNVLIDSGATCMKLLALPGNKLLAAGTYLENGRTHFHLTRFNADGSVDNSFGNNGTGIDLDTTYMAVYGAIRQPDGRIIVCGDYYDGQGYRMKLVRFTAIGKVDSSFGVNGRAVTQVTTGTNNTYGRNVLLQPDGKIILAGCTNNGGTDMKFIVMRYTANGVLDAGYGTNGITVTDIGPKDDNAYAAAIQADGKVVHVGDTYDGSHWQLAVLRYDTSGHLDNTFGTNGQVLMPIGTDVYGYSVLIQGSGQKIVIGAYSEGNYNLLLRLNSNGSTDNSFGVNGISARSFNTFDAANRIDTLSNGDIIMSARTTGNNMYAWAKFSSMGVLDTTIGDSGLVTITVNNSYDNVTSMAIDDSNHVVIGGYYNTTGGYKIAMARFRSGVKPPVTNSVQHVTPMISLELYPVPASNKLNIGISNASPASYKISIVDAAGHIVMQWQTSSSSVYRNTADISTLPAGHYWLHVNGLQGSVAKGFVIMR